MIELTNTKCDKPRTVPINSELRKAIKAYREACKRTADRDQPGSPLTANAVAAWFLDLYTRRMNWTGYSSHSGRRTFATLAGRNAVTAGGSLRDVQDMLGHANLNTTQRYLEPSSNAKRKLVELI